MVAQSFSIVCECVSECVCYEVKSGWPASLCLLLRFMPRKPALFHYTLLIYKGSTTSQQLCQTGINTERYDLWENTLKPYQPSRMDRLETDRRQALWQGAQQQKVDVSNVLLSRTTNIVCSISSEGPSSKYSGKNMHAVETAETRKVKRNHYLEGDKREVAGCKWSEGEHGKTRSLQLWRGKEMHTEGGRRNITVRMSQKE